MIILALTLCTITYLIFDWYDEKDRREFNNHYRRESL